MTHLNEIHTEIEADSQNMNNFLAEIKKAIKNLNILGIKILLLKRNEREQKGNFLKILKGE